MTPFRVEVLLSPAELSEAVIREQQLVVIDVLRATTVIGVALAAGARRVIPAAGIEEAVALKAQIGPEDTLLCGERDGRPIPGFDLGNSPAEYRPETVADRTLILASTNGSVLLSRSQPARRVLVAGFNTLGAVARRMAADGGDWTIVGSGKMGRPCLEDLACAGGLVARLEAAGGRDRLPTDALDLATDGARIARDIFERYHADIPGFLAETAHGRYLAAIGFEGDFVAAGTIDALDLVPEMVDGRIVDAARAGERNVPVRPARPRRPSARAGATRG